MRRIPGYFKRLRKNPAMQAPSLKREFLRILFWGAGGSLAVYAALGFAVNILVPFIPPAIDQSLGQLFAAKWSEINRPEQEKLQTLLDELVKLAPEAKGPFDIKVIENKEANAMAYPGNHILVTTELLKEIRSENEIAFILGHELGHFINRDYLKGLGRILLFYLATEMLFGNDNALVDFLGKLITGAEMKFSQKQELQADSWALELLERHYGHVGGATDFFQRLAEGKERGKKNFYYFSTHPHPEKRIQQIREISAKRDYLIKDQVLNRGSDGDSSKESD